MMEENMNTSSSDESTSGKTVAKPGKSGKPRGVLNKLLLVAVVAAVGLFAWAESQRREVVGRLKQTEQRLEEIQTSTQRSGKAIADEVLGKLRAHIDIPQDPAPTVATIVDVETLRKNNQFYNKAENGDHLVLTENRAILYDADRDIVLDVVPVVVNRQAGPSGSPGTSPTQSPGASPTGSPSPTSGQFGTPTPLPNVTR